MRNNKNGLISFSIGLDTDIKTGDRVIIYTARDVPAANGLEGKSRNFKEYQPTRQSVDRIQDFIKYNPPKVKLEIDRPTPARFNGRYYDYIDIELYTANQ